MPLIRTENLHYTYEDGTPALNGINLDIEAGEFLAVLGSNGSGKTTLIKHLNGLLRPTLGRVLFDDKPIESVAEREVFSRIGIVFQDPNDQLFASTVEEDVAFGPTNMGLAPQQIKERVHEALHRVGMEDFARKSIHALSHGQKKRICIAGILAMAPQVIVLDEPTAGLDPMGVHSLMHLLEDLNKKQGVTMIMATHVVDLVPLFMSKIAILSRGRVLRSGTPVEVFGDPEAIEKAKLHLPLIAELMNILKTRDHVKLHHIPLTVGEARHEILRLLSVQDVIERV
ncbi:cobalt/nickel transport system ATP-binding protein [Geoalkalibacter ferrihydriticus]|uniref:ABC transporter ATP-binding protein n=2 Tax=Geoalkalibacter ferrihydriticus TaxID=392333 RepID=A0A0C2HMY9_9BACT|nr:ATP-binding cassette domain-containing protein [Geoalkalibacter ferrihydriticus]KIH76335.1 cobalt transporter ATP-binding subunit [Geoalkalibacter ferrihydriticus DSM 17813]SDL19937.1 cobalt/nickel transport system ATP-binding protein [Geoalkalibacter ferrihydriticus]